MRHLASEICVTKGISMQKELEFQGCSQNWIFAAIIQANDTKFSGNNFMTPTNMLYNFQRNGLNYLRDISSQSTAIIYAPPCTYVHEFTSAVCSPSGQSVVICSYARYLRLLFLYFLLCATILLFVPVYPFLL